MDIALSIAQVAPATTGFRDFVQVFLSIVLEATPFILIGSLLSGVMEVFVPSEAVGRLMPKRKLAAVMVGAACGVFLPMCECGIIPVVRRLLRKGVPLGAAVAYMLAAPIINPVVVVSTYVAFRFQPGQGPVSPGVFMVVARTALGFGVAVATGLIVSQLGGAKLLVAAAAETHDPGHHEHAETLAAKIVQVLRHAGGDFLEILFFLILGSALAAAVNIGLHRSVVQPLASREVLATASMMGLAVLLNVCSEADAFVAATFRAFSLGSLLGFLVLGPMLDLKLLIMYTRLYRPRLIVLLCSCTVLLTLVACLLAGRLAPEWRAAPIASASGTSVPVGGAP